MTDLLAEVDELLARVLEQPEQLVDGGEDGRGRPEHGRGRRRRGRGVVLPAVLREQLVHQAPEQRVEREVPLRQNAATRSESVAAETAEIRTESEGGGREQGEPTLKSSRSRVRRSVAARSAPIGMPTLHSLRIICCSNSVPYL